MRTTRRCAVAAGVGPLDPAQEGGPAPRGGGCRAQTRTDATFGFGVVFSEETLGRLRDADEPSFTAITDAWASWTTYRRALRWRADPLPRPPLFRAIRRTKTRHPSTPGARAGCGAGLRAERCKISLASSPKPTCWSAPTASTSLRAAHARAGLRAQAGRHSTPRASTWFGTDVALDAFTFAFAETQHGVFQAHAYPFDEHRSHVHRRDARGHVVRARG